MKKNPFEMCELKYFCNAEHDWTLPVLIVDDQPWFVLKYIMAATGDKRPATVIKTTAGEELYRVFAKSCFTGMKNAPARGYACLSRKGLSRYFKTGRALFGTEVCEWVKGEVLPLLEGVAAPAPVTRAMPTVPAQRQFHHDQFGDLTVIEIDGEPWFIGKEVAEKLGYSNTQKAILNHVDDEDKQFISNKSELSQNGTVKIDSHYGMMYINESGLYGLILKSKLSLAKQFKRWVTSEVLPTIRKHGAYMTPETLTDALARPENLLVLLQTLQDEQNKNQRLAAANVALAKEENTWDQTKVLNALVRSYAARQLNNDYAHAWNAFYKRLEYKYGIQLKIRAGRRKDGKMLLDYLTKDELPLAISVASAMCEECGANVGEINNKTTDAVCGVA